jgi:hypothetical protein
MVFIEAYSAVRDDVAGDLADTVGKTWPDPTAGAASVAVGQVFFAIAPAGAISSADDNRLVAGERRTYRKVSSSTWMDLGDAAAQVSREMLRTIVKADLGLGAVDNTSDATKPVSIAQQAALSAKPGGALTGGAWVIKPTAPRLRLGGAGKVTFDTMASDGTILLAVVSYTAPGDDGQFLDVDYDIYKVRASLTDTATAEVL